MGRSSTMMLFFKLLSLAAADVWRGEPIRLSSFYDYEIGYERHDLTCTPPARIECQEQCCDWSLRRQNFRCTDISVKFYPASSHCCHCDETPGVTRHKMCCSCVAPEAPITAPPREGVMSGSWQKISCPSGMVLSEPLTLCGRYSGCGPENYSWSTRSYCSSTCATSYGDCDSEAVCQTCIPTGTVSASTTTTTRPSFPYGASETCPDKPTTTTTTPNPYGTRRWEQVGIANRSACRGKNVNDNNQSYYTVRAAQSLEDCQELCRADFPRCKGIEYSKGRCELWTRVDGIFIAKELNGFTCMRFGWQTRALFRFGGEAACRGKGSTYLVKVAHSVEECKAQCSAADLCTGIEFSMGRCEIWQSPIEFYVFRSGFACFRYDPENPALLFP